MKPGRLERAFINAFQGGFPIIERPYRFVAERLGCSEQALLASIEQLLATGVLSRFGPLYNAVQFGGGLTLAAMAVPDAHYRHVTELVNQFPEVAHNYRREHELNMWFVLATESRQDIPATLKRIEAVTGLKVHDFPKQREFYVGLWLQLDAAGRASTVPLPAAFTDPAAAPDAVSGSIEGIDRKIIQTTQAGLPLVEHPYRAIAEQCGIKPETIRLRLQHMLERGIIRRIGAVPNHYRLGLKANGMTVWDVADEQVMTLGRRLAGLDFVSHCYLRPRELPVWRYNLFAMVHGHTRDEVEAKARQIGRMLGDDCKAGATLFSTAILKKTGMRMAA